MGGPGFKRNRVLEPPHLRVICGGPRAGRRTRGMSLRRAGFIALLAATAVAASSAPQAAAAGSCSLAGAVNWKANAPGPSWFNPANWSTGAVPTSSDDVCIQNAPPGGFVSIGNPNDFIANAASLESTQPITISGGV